MNTIERSSSSRLLGRLAGAMLGAIALSSVMLACAAPTEPNEPNEQTGTESAALANNGGGGTGSTCESRWQSCYASCGAIYGGGSKADPKTQQQCEDLCDSIHDECAPASPARGIVVARPIGTVRQMQLAP